MTHCRAAASVVPFAAKGFAVLRLRMSPERFGVIGNRQPDVLGFR